jgi:hypothetical protein
MEFSDRFGVPVYGIYNMTELSADEAVKQVLELKRDREAKGEVVEQRHGLVSAEQRPEHRDGKAKTQDEDQSLMPLILKFLVNWAKSGPAVVIVEQHLRIASPVADRAILMERGSVALISPADSFAHEMAQRSLTASPA